VNALPGLPADSASLPANSAAAESVADAYTRGTFAMQAGQTAEAIAALEEAVKLDPDFTDAWGKLAILYQKDGKAAKATEAFKKAKRLGDANGGTGTRDAAGGLQIP
jgi:Tfp pilus assembly protein PilF